MASLVVRNLDDRVKERLRLIAAAKGHSMEEEVRRILTLATQDGGGPGARKGLAQEIRDLVHDTGGFLDTHPPHTEQRGTPTIADQIRSVMTKHGVELDFDLPERGEIQRPITFEEDS